MLSAARRPSVSLIISWWKTALAHQLGAFLPPELFGRGAVTERVARRLNASITWCPRGQNLEAPLMVSRQWCTHRSLRSTPESLATDGLGVRRAATRNASGSNKLTHGGR